MEVKSIIRNSLVLAGAFFLASCSGPKSEMDKFIDDLLSKMTVEEQIGQLNLHSHGFRASAALTDDNETVKAVKSGQMGALFGVGSDISTLTTLEEKAKVILDAPVSHDTIRRTLKNTNCGLTETTTGASLKKKTWNS